MLLDGAFVLPIGCFTLRPKAVSRLAYNAHFNCNFLQSNLIIKLTIIK